MFFNHVAKKRTAKTGCPVQLELQVHAQPTLVQEIPQSTD